MKIQKKLGGGERGLVRVGGVRVDVEEELKFVCFFFGGGGGAGSGWM